MTFDLVHVLFLVESFTFAFTLARYQTSTKLAERLANLSGLNLGKFQCQSTIIQALQWPLLIVSVRNCFACYISGEILTVGGWHFDGLSRKTETYSTVSDLWTEQGDYFAYVSRPAIVYLNYGAQINANLGPIF